MNFIKGKEEKAVIESDQGSPGPGLITGIERADWAD